MRCKACDRPLKEAEIIWHEDRQSWEDLCGVCRSAIYNPTKEEVAIKNELSELYVKKINEE